MTERYVEANNVFKILREHDMVHPTISRRKAIKALVRLLGMESSGTHRITNCRYPIIPPLLSTEVGYNQMYLDQVFGTLRYIRGDYVGKDK